MKSNILKLTRLIALATAGLAISQSLDAADLLNGGFDSTTGWTSPGSIKAGNEGGNGWNADYFGGAYPTNNTFASGIKGPVRQDLSGAGNTFIEGVTYELSMAIFGSSNYATDTNVLWSLGFTAAGEVAVIDHWFSDEYSASTVGAGNGGTIPDDHITTVAPGSTGLRTVTLTYTATAADAGKVIGVQLAGHTQSRYTLAAGAPTPDDWDWYGMMDNVTFQLVGLPTILSFTSDTAVIDGLPIRLSWELGEIENLTTLTLDDGNGGVSVADRTDLESGEGGMEVNPTENTTYTLTANGLVFESLTIYNGEITGFTSNITLAMGPDYQATLSWNVKPDAPASVTISDGTESFDVTADTSGGFGSRTFTVPSASTTFTLDINAGSATKTVRVLRAVPADPDKFWLAAGIFYQGEAATVLWKDAANASGSWVGLYKKADLPGPQYATQWSYIDSRGGADGSINFTGLAPGEYYTLLFVDGGYTIEQGPVYFTVSSESATPLTISSFTRAGDVCTITWGSQPDVTYDLYASSDLSEWTLIQENIPSGGASTTTTEDLATLADGIPVKRFYRVAK